MEIKSWEEYFLDLARTCASRSNCLRAQVGAVIVGDDKKIKATGYNGTPSKVESCYERGKCYRIENNIESGTRYETDLLWPDKKVILFLRENKDVYIIAKNTDWKCYCTEEQFDIDSFLKDIGE